MCWIACELEVIFEEVCLSSTASFDDEMSMQKV
jgi:hypothetical protein